MDAYMCLNLHYSINFLASDCRGFHHVASQLHRNTPLHMHDEYLEYRLSFAV